MHRLRHRELPLPVNTIMYLPRVVDGIRIDGVGLGPEEVSVYSVTGSGGPRCPRGPLRSRRSLGGRCRSSPQPEELVRIRRELLAVVRDRDPQIVSIPAGLEPGGPGQGRILVVVFGTRGSSRNASPPPPGAAGHEHRTPAADPRPWQVAGEIELVLLESLIPAQRAPGGLHPEAGVRSLGGVQVVVGRVPDQREERLEVSWVSGLSTNPVSSVRVVLVLTSDSSRSSVTVWLSRR